MRNWKVRLDTVKVMITPFKMSFVLCTKLSVGKFEIHIGSGTRSILLQNVLLIYGLRGLPENGVSESHRVQVSMNVRTYIRRVENPLPETSVLFCLWSSREGLGESVVLF